MANTLHDPMRLATTIENSAKNSKAKNSKHRGVKLSADLVDICSLDYR